MSKVTVKVDAGVCQFKTVIEATSDEEMNVEYRIISECPSVRNMAKSLNPMSIMDIIQGPMTENVIYECASCLSHACCVVPSAMIKAAEVAGDLALKRNVSFNFE